MRPWRVPFAKFGAGPGLARVAAVAERLGVDLPAFAKTGAVVVGSNGKGSTAALAAALLGQTGASVGLFTSPHLLDLNERFRIDGEDIADAELEQCWARVTAAAAALGLSGDLGGFEFLFLIAADWFAARGCAHTVWEAGIGGRLDPVRLIQAPRLALTSLDLEHTDLLGHTLEEIARDKLDAAPAGATVFINQNIAVLSAIEAHCAARGFKLCPAPQLSLQQGAKLNLAGAFQRENAALGVALAKDAAALGGEEVERGLAGVRWPGRLETIESDPLIVIDVGHTPAGVRAALDGFHALRGARDAILVVGVSRDKDVAAIAALLAGDFDHIICTSPAHKGARPGDIAVHASAANPRAELAIAECVADARRLALARAKPGENAIYVAGGLFLAAEFKAVHLGRDPASVAFF